jgi:hypothetical protein
MFCPSCKELESVAVELNAPLECPECGAVTRPGRADVAAFASMLEDVEGSFRSGNADEVRWALEIPLPLLREDASDEFLAANPELAERFDAVTMASREMLEALEARPAASTRRCRARGCDGAMHTAAKCPWRFA